MRTPLGRPVANAKKSPLMPAVVACGAVRRSIAVSVSLPVSVSFERLGASVVVPPGRGPREDVDRDGAVRRELDARVERDAGPEDAGLGGSGRGEREREQPGGEEAAYHRPDPG